MNRLVEILKFVFLLCLIFLTTGSSYISKSSDAEVQTSSFSIDVTKDQVIVIRKDEYGSELFKLVIMKNGGILQIAISQVTYAEKAGGFIWSSPDSNQTLGSNAVAEPIIKNMGDYVIVTCYGKYRSHSLSFVTNITISKNGVILIFQTMTAEKDEIALDLTSWGLLLPADLFAGKEAYVNQEGTVRTVRLPAHRQSTAEFNITSLFGIRRRPVYWMDFSTALEGITLINLDTGAFRYYTINDRRWGNYQGFSAHFMHMDRGGPGFNAMKKGDTRTAKIVIYIHGPGGYENYLDLINLIAGLGSSMSDAKKGMAEYKDAGAKSLATQAYNAAMKGLNRIILGDIAEAKADMNKALSMLKQAENAERNAMMMRDALYVIIPIIATIIAVFAVLKFRRKKL